MPTFETTQDALNYLCAEIDKLNIAANHQHNLLIAVLASIISDAGSLSGKTLKALEILARESQNPLAVKVLSAIDKSNPQSPDQKDGPHLTIVQDEGE